MGPGQQSRISGATRRTVRAGCQMRIKILQSICSTDWLAPSDRRTGTESVVNMWFIIGCPVFF
jgi:hypothetical protein